MWNKKAESLEISVALSSPCIEELGAPDKKLMKWKVKLGGGRRRGGEEKEKP